MIQNVLHKYDLRCVLVYANGKVWCGQWNRSSPDDPATCASMQPRDGLLYAAIEGKDKATKAQTVLAKVTADSFMQFRWVGAVRAPGGAVFGSVKRHPTVIGLTLVERHQEAIVLRSGKVEYKVKTIQLRGR